MASPENELEPNLPVHTGSELCLCLPCQARRANFVVTEDGSIAWNVRDIFFHNMPPPAPIVYEYDNYVMAAASANKFLENRAYNFGVSPHLETIKVEH